MPSRHVWPNLLFPALPQFPNQEPPCPQQLDLADFFMVPHLGHTELTDGIVTASVNMWRMVNHKERMLYMAWSLSGVVEQSCIHSH